MDERLKMRIMIATAGSQRVHAGGRLLDGAVTGLSSRTGFMRGA
jgi:hypothetical protein